MRRGRQPTSLFLDRIGCFETDASPAFQQRENPPYTPLEIFQATVLGHPNDQLEISILGKSLLNKPIGFSPVL